MAHAPWSRRDYVGLVLFAGAPNPRWTQSPEVFARLKLLLEQQPATHLAQDYVRPNSWYGGVALHIANDPQTHGRRRLLVHGGYIFDSATEVIRRDADRRLEKMLFATMPIDLNNFLDRLTFDQVIVALNENKKVIGATAGEAKPNCAGAPAFAVAPPAVKWDAVPGINDNNCYNYSNNEFSAIDDAQPGRKPWEPRTESEMHKLLVRDKLIPVGTNRKKLPAVCSTLAGAHLIAVCLRQPSGTKLVNGVQVTLYKDYHCFRLDHFSGGARWTHKDGETESTDNDNRGANLVDLATGNFKIEHVLVGYYWSVPGRRKIDIPVFP